MKCHECGNSNPDGALFCANCGVKFGERPSPTHMPKHMPQHKIDCPICGAENTGNDKFCLACGAELRRQHVKQQKHHSHQSRQNKTNGNHSTRRFKWTPATITAVIIGGVLGFIGFIELVKEKPPAPPPSFVEAKTNDTKLEAKVLDVASKFICSCGTCGEKPLDTCTCDKAAEERQFIRNYLQAGQTPEQVIPAVMKTYGWLKPEFEAKYDSISTIKSRLSTVAAAKETQTVFAMLSAKKNEENKIALVSDAESIYAHFRCACGQCGMDELKTCTCKHPRGATEVKAYVQAKISEAKFTVAQITDDIETKYGGRKF